MEQESEDKDNEIAANNEEIQKLGDQVYALEDENDKLREEYERLSEDNIAERERLEALSAALKDVSLIRHLTSCLFNFMIPLLSLFVETCISQKSTPGNDGVI